ncbi:hypothetical protein [Pseudomonas sp.]|uniref:hypothetical protein n=1 Tax=Pseudomonas sp. TaxID=306 RepID=UPI002588B15E|nr:hypothetical protein [Pseudomonas sp.]
MSQLLIHEPPLQVLPSLAVALGLSEAIILQQIHYWSARSTTVINGHAWVYNTVSQWREQFPFWSDDTISRALKSLRERGVVVAERLSQNPFDKTLYYRIDYSKVPTSMPATCGDLIPATCGNRSTQNASLSYTETTNRDSETTKTEKAPRKRSTPAKPARFDPLTIDLPAAVPGQAWADWIAYRKTRKLSTTEQTAKAQLKKLADWAAKGHKPETIIADSIANGWQGLFEPKGETSKPAGKPRVYHDIRNMKYTEGVNDDLSF